MKPNAILKGLESVTKDWTKQKKREERKASARLRRQDNLYRVRSKSIRDAAFEIMREAYMKASANGKLPAHARQIYYAARGHILKETERDRLSDSYFTQVLLPEYIKYHSEAHGWNVVYDARGHLQEPHARRGEEVALGTLEVRKHLIDIHGHKADLPSATIEDGDRYPTKGPQHRYGAILFIEKEGFLPLFEQVHLAERYDIAIMSTKGFSNVASRRLVDSICGRYDIPLLVLHDFDVAGFGIVKTLQSGSWRYRYSNSVKVVDIGLRIKDVEEYDLESEDVYHRREFCTDGMTKKEIAFLQDERVELNAFASDELVEFIESKLQEHDIEKIVPDAGTLEDCYRRMVYVEHLEEAIRKASVEGKKVMETVKVPARLKGLVDDALDDDDTQSWDGAIREIVKNDAGERPVKQARKRSRPERDGRTAPMRQVVERLRGAGAEVSVKQSEGGTCLIMAEPRPGQGGRDRKAPEKRNARRGADGRGPWDR